MSHMMLGSVLMNSDVQYSNKKEKEREKLPVTDEAHDPEPLISQQAPNCLQSQSSGPQLPVNKYQTGMTQNWRPASSFLK